MKDLSLLPSVDIMRDLPPRLENRTIMVSSSHTKVSSFQFLGNPSPCPASVSCVLHGILSLMSDVREADGELGATVTLGEWDEEISRGPPDRNGIHKMAPVTDDRKSPGQSGPVAIFTGRNRLGSGGF